MMIFSEPVFKIFETVKSKILNIAIIYISDFYVQFIIFLIECQNFKIVVLLIKAVVHFNFSVQIKIRYFIYSIFFFLLYFFLYFMFSNFFMSNLACLMSSRFSCSTIRLFSFLKWNSNPLTLLLPRPVFFWIFFYYFQVVFFSKFA